MVARHVQADGGTRVGHDGIGFRAAAARVAEEARSIDQALVLKIGQILRHCRQRELQLAHQILSGKRPMLP